MRCLSIPQVATGTVVVLLTNQSFARAQSSQEMTALAYASAEALQPAMLTLASESVPLSFESQSPWGFEVKKRLERALGRPLDVSNPREANRVQLPPPSLRGNMANVDVWFGSCVATDSTDTFTVVIRTYRFEFIDGGWVLRGDSILGTTEGRCEGDTDTSTPLREL